MELKPINIKIGNKDAIYYQTNNEGINATFYPANGFPIGTYSKFLKQLIPEFKLKCLELRACWPNIGAAPLQTNWETYADDLILFIERNFNKPIIGIGHSQGATASVIAASRRPDLFKSLILIEPAFISDFLAFVLKVTPYFIKKHTQPLKSALLKNDIWESREAFFEHYKKNRAYKRISDNVLRDFADFGLQVMQDGKFRLTFSSKWEASNYSLGPSIWKYLKKVKLPIQVLAGKPSVFFSENLRQKWTEKSPNSSISINNDFGHLFPLEAPEICAKLITS